MYLWLCTLFVVLIVGPSWATNRNVTLTDKQETLQKSLPRIEVHSDGSKTAEVLNRNNQQPRYTPSGPTLKWVQFQGSAPSGAVSIWNSYAKRTEYPCYEPGCTPGFYSPDRGPYCLYPSEDKEYQGSPFWILVNENSFELLEWQSYSWGKLPLNSIHSCLGPQLYVGKNKYGLGKVDLSNQAFYIGINGKEYWYRYYEVAVVNKDYLTQRIYNVRYMKERGTYTNETLTLFSTIVVNNGCDTVKKTTSLSTRASNEHLWDFSSSVSIGVRSTMTTGIYSVVNGGWSMTTERTYSWFNESTLSRSVPVSKEWKVDVSPNHICNTTIEGEIMYGDIPFTATVTREYRDGETRSATIQGVSKNTIVAHLGAHVKSCQPIPNAPPC